MKTKKITLKPETTLERAVAKILKAKAKDHTDMGAFIEDLLQHGCQSRIIGELYYYVDTVKFYQKHKAEINRLLYQTGQDCGVGPQEMFGEKWNCEDPLAIETLNQNLLAWFGFEEIARQLGERAGLEI